VNSAAGRCAIAHCAKLLHTIYGRRMSPPLSRIYVPKTGFKSGGLRHIGPCRGESTTAGSFDTVAQLKQAIGGVSLLDLGGRLRQ